MDISPNSIVSGLFDARTTSLAQAQNVTKKQETEKFSTADVVKPAKDSGQDINAVHPVPAMNETARALFYVQQVASEAVDEAPQEKTPVDDFLEYMDKSSTELWREQILRSMGLTEESLAALPPEKRRAVEEKIEQIIRDDIEKAAKENAAKAETKQLSEKAGLPDENTHQHQAANANLSAIQKLDPRVALMAELPAETYDQYMKSIEKFEELNRKEEKEFFV